jgi:hypothetical protein
VVVGWRSRSWSRMSRRRWRRFGHEGSASRTCKAGSLQQPDGSTVTWALGFLSEGPAWAPFLINYGVSVPEWSSRFGGPGFPIDPWSLDHVVVEAPDPMGSASWLRASWDFLSRGSAGVRLGCRCLDARPPSRPAPPTGLRVWCWPALTHRLGRWPACGTCARRRDVPARGRHGRALMPARPPGLGTVSACLVHGLVMPSSGSRRVASRGRCGAARRRCWGDRAAAGCRWRGCAGWPWPVGCCQAPVSGSRRAPSAARTGPGASAAHSPIAASDLAPASTAATATASTVPSGCCRPRRWRGSVMVARSSSRLRHWAGASATGASSCCAAVGIRDDVGTGTGIQRGYGR